MTSRALTLTSSIVWMPRRNDTTSDVLNQAAAPAGLRRALGKWDLTAIGVNQVLGASVFAIPATIAAAAGAWAAWMVAAVGLASLMIALCFAEVGSRFEGTGGPYLYTRAAFGRFAAFGVGWMMWFTRAVSWAAVINVLVSPVIPAAAILSALTILAGARSDQLIAGFIALTVGAALYFIAIGSQD